MRHSPGDLPGDLFLGPFRVFRDKTGADHLLGEAPHPESHRQSLGRRFSSQDGRKPIIQHFIGEGLFSFIRLC